MALMHEWAEDFAAEAVHEKGKLTAVRLLQHRFGALPADLRSRIKQLPVDALDELATATLDFKDLAEAEAWIARARRNRQ